MSITQHNLSYHITSRHIATTLTYLGTAWQRVACFKEDSKRKQKREGKKKNSMPLLQETSPSPELSPLAIGEDISPLPTIKPAGTTEVDFSGLLASPLRLHEDLANGCGGQLWPAGMTLARHMLRYHRDDLRKSRMWVDASPFPS